VRFCFGLFVATEERHTENTEKSLFSVFSVRFSSLACVARCCIELRNPGLISVRVRCWLFGFERFGYGSVGEPLADLPGSGAFS